MPRRPTRRRSPDTPGCHLSGRHAALRPLQRSAASLACGFSVSPVLGRARLPGAPRFTPAGGRISFPVGVSRMALVSAPGTGLTTGQVSAGLDG